MPWARIGWPGDSVAAVPDRFGRTAGSRWVRTSAGAVVGWRSASRAAGGLPDPVGGDQAAPFTIAAAVPDGFGVHDRRLHSVRPAVRDRSHWRAAARLADWHRASLVPGLCEGGSGRFGRGLRQGSSSNSPSWRGRVPPGGVVGVFRRTRCLGGLCAPHLRRKLTLYFEGACRRSMAVVISTI